ncbi:MAG: hypothetical protein ACREFO_19000 [Acetobacteraceae bacterium]
MDGKPKPIDRAPLCSDERQITGAEDIVFGHLGVIDRNGKQAGALLVGQQEAVGHDGLVSMREAVHNKLAFRDYSERGY